MMRPARPIPSQQAGGGGRHIETFPGFAGEAVRQNDSEKPRATSSWSHGVDDRFERKFGTINQRGCPSFETATLWPPREEGQQATHLPRTGRKIDAVLPPNQKY